MCERGRSSIEIMSDILEEARGGSLKTHIVYGANLNNTSGGDYLDTLMKAGLLEERDRRYYTTEKGLIFLGLVSKIEEMLGLDV